MCLIVHSPDGSLMPREAYDYARWTNNDGIGIMSSAGIAKFVGRKSGKRAWRYLRRLEAEKVAYGLHFRWATHGDVNRDNCHPFTAPKSDAVIMHNGVLRQTAVLATKQHSDTAIFVQKYMVNAPDTEHKKYAKFYDKLAKFIGWENKFLVFHERTNDFTIVNEDEGSWIDGLWYSNEYSLPDTMLPARIAQGKAARWFGHASLAQHSFATRPDAPVSYGSPDYGFPLPTLAAEYAAADAVDEYADRRVRDGIGCGIARNWRDERDTAIAAAVRAGTAGASGNVTTQADYYRLLELENPSGYLEDGCELGARAARGVCNGDMGLPINAGEMDGDRDYLEFLKRSGLNPRA